MTRELQTIAWAQDQLKHGNKKSTYNWLRQHRILIVGGKFLEEKFWAVYDAPSAKQRAYAAVDNHFGGPPS